MKIFRSRLFYFLIGVILSGSVAYAAGRISASEITYIDKNNVEKTVDVVLDDLYDLANRDISFSSATYNQVMGDIPTESKTTLTLSKGTYLVVANLNLGLVNPTGDIANPNKYFDTSLTVACSSCTYKQLSARYYHPKASATNTNHTPSGKRVHLETYLVTYYVTVTANQGTITVSKARSWSSTLPHVIALQAVPINYQ